MPPRLRSRSRSDPRYSRLSPRGRSLVARFGKGEKGETWRKSYWRRYKPACLNILEYLLWFVIELATRSSHPVPRSIQRRQAQIERKIWECRRNRLPRRQAPLLERLSDSEDSVVAETVVVSVSSSDEEPFRPVPSAKTAPKARRRQHIH